VYGAHPIQLIMTKRSSDRAIKGKLQKRCKCGRPIDF